MSNESIKVIDLKQKLFSRVVSAAIFSACYFICSPISPVRAEQKPQSLAQQISKISLVENDENLDLKAVVDFTTTLFPSNFKSLLLISLPDQASYVAQSHSVFIDLENIKSSGLQYITNNNSTNILFAQRIGIPFGIIKTYPHFFIIAKLLHEIGHAYILEELGKDIDFYRESLKQYDLTVLELQEQLHYADVNLSMPKVSKLFQDGLPETSAFAYRTLFSEKHSDQFAGFVLIKYFMRNNPKILSAYSQRLLEQYAKGLKKENWRQPILNILSKNLPDKHSKKH